MLRIQQVWNTDGDSICILFEGALEVELSPLYQYLRPQYVVVLVLQVLLQKVSLLVQLRLSQGNQTLSVICDDSTK